MKKVLLVATVQSHIAQFHKPLINWLKEQGHIVDVVARNNLHLKRDLVLTEPNKIFDVNFSRSPFSLKNVKAYKQLKKIINDNNYDIIHCNTPVGGMITRLVANKKRKKGELTVVYEAHGFHFFKGGSKKNWLIYYPIEKWLSKKTDVLITINKIDYELAKKTFKAKKIEYVPGVGVDLDQFQEKNSGRNIKTELNIKEDSKIILSVGELNKNKNQKVIIEALSKINDKNLHYLIAGNGPLETKLKKQTAKLRLNDNVHFLGYRRDLIDIFERTNVFVLPSYREGLGVAALEAMAYGIPIVTSNRHGINDYSIDGKTGFKFDPNDSDGFACGIKKIIDDEKLSATMSEYNKEKFNEFSLKNSLTELKKIYEPLLEN